MMVYNKTIELIDYGLYFLLKKTNTGNTNINSSNIDFLIILIYKS